MVVGLVFGEVVGPYKDGLNGGSTGTATGRRGQGVVAARGEGGAVETVRAGREEGGGRAEGGREGHVGRDGGGK